MKATAKLLFFTALILALSAWLLPQRFFHYFLDRNPEIDHRYQRAIEDQQPDLVFVGNSILKKALDFEQLDTLMESRVLDLSVNATTAPDWYLFLKNNIATSSKRPLTVVVFFTDYRLTAIPGLRGEEDQKRISKFAGRDEPVFDSLVYDISPIERFTLETVAPYAYQTDLRDILEAPFQYGLPRLVYGWDDQQIDLAVEATFANDNMNPGLLELARQESEVFGDGAAPSADLFASSFLPHLIQIADQNEIDLIFARIPTLRYLEPQLQPPELLAYIQALSDYLAAHDVPFIDFTGLTPGLSAEGFRDNDHLNDIGRPIFTPIVAQMMNQLGFP